MNALMKYTLKTSMFLFLCLLSVFTLAQPQPGDLFREYTWTTPSESKNSPYLRVGGKMDYEIKTNIYPDLKIEGRNIPFPFYVDLKGAKKAEITVEKVLCHPGTQNLRISLNDHAPLVLPESEYIPEPQNWFMHHFFPTFEIPLNNLSEGTDNYFSLSVDDNIRWPQNLVYGVTLRIYYSDAASPNEISVRIISNNEQEVVTRLSGKLNGISSVDYIARYDGPDSDGDGIYHEWHYRHHRGKILNHAGSSGRKPFEINWPISWIPDQKEPVLLSALVHYNDGKIQMLPETKLVIKRNSYSVELCKPDSVPQFWVTRKGEHHEIFNIRGPVKNITEARMIFTSWSPGYLNGIYINDFSVFTREGPKYQYMQHEIPVSETGIFKQGGNVLKTGRTPKYNGKMVHGTEIMWPGIMLLVKYRNNDEE